MNPAEFLEQVLAFKKMIFLPKGEYNISCVCHEIKCYIIDFIFYIVYSIFRKWIFMIVQPNCLYFNYPGERNVKRFRI